MNAPPAFQFYADDFLAGVADMTQAEVGAYILLLCHQWNRGSAPVEPERQQLVAKGAVSAHVLSKFKIADDGGIKNARLEKEREKQAEYREKQRVKGLASGASRAAKAEERTNRGSTVVRTVVEPKGEPEGNSPSPSPIYNTPIVPLQGTGQAAPLKKGQLQLRAEAMFRRKSDTPLTAAEQRAFKKNADAIKATTEEDWRLLEAFYAAPQSETYSRKDLPTLVNNWNGEIDRARAWKCDRPPRQAQQRPEPTVRRIDMSAA